MRLSGALWPWIFQIRRPYGLLSFVRYCKALEMGDPEAISDTNPIHAAEGGTDQAPLLEVQRPAAGRALDAHQHN